MVDSVQNDDRNPGGDTGVRRFCAITGGPGSGKSTLVAALRQAGHVCAEEAGRAIIQYQLRIDGPALPWRDAALFAEQMLGWELRSHRWAHDQHGVVFFDRGVPDIIGYLRLSGCDVPTHISRAASLFRYRRQVFIAPPWRAIFKQDAERHQSWEEAVRTHDAMVEVYTEHGYELVELPCVSVDDRVAFIQERLELAPGDAC